MTTIQERIILVIGGTGTQGGAVVDSLLSDGWPIRVFTRDASNIKANNLLSRGAEIIEGNLSDVASLERAIDGVYGVYSMQSLGADSRSQIDQDLNSDTTGAEIEFQWGKNVADVAKRFGAELLVYSSVAGVEKRAYPGAAPKYEIEKYIRSIDIPYTFIRPASFMENYQRLKRGILHGEITRQLKPTTREDTVAAKDIGAFVAAAFKRRDEFQGHGIDIAGDNPTMDEVAAAVTHRIGKSVTYTQMPREQVEQRLPEGLVALMDWIENEGYGVNIPALKERWGVPLTTFAEWLAMTDWEQ